MAEVREVVHQHIDEDGNIYTHTHAHTHGNDDHIHMHGHIHGNDGSIHGEDGHTHDGKEHGEYLRDCENHEDHAKDLMHAHEFLTDVNHDHSHTHDHAHEHSHDHSHIHDHAHEHSHDHSHTHDHKQAAVHTHSHGHGHVHSAAEKKQVLNRLSRAIGHLESVRRMVERDEDCSDVLIQLAAVRGALTNTGKIVLKNHINHCVTEAVQQNDEEMIALLNEAIDKFVK